MNNILSDEHKAWIKSTPFGWLLTVDKELQMRRMLVKELCFKFVEKDCGFKIGFEVVSFTLLDVCVGLGLRVCGQKVDIEKETSDGNLRSFFGSNRVNITMLYDELLKHVNDSVVVDFCKLYILLGLCEFFLPNTKGIVHDGLFSVVDNNLGDLCKYNWGGVVYQYLVRSLCEGAAASIQKVPAPLDVYIVGCTYLLQVNSILSSKVLLYIVRNS